MGKAQLQDSRRGRHLIWQIPPRNTATGWGWQAGWGSGTALGLPETHTSVRPMMPNLTCADGALCWDGNLVGITLIISLSSSPLKHLVLLAVCLEVGIKYYFIGKWKVGEHINHPGFYVSKIQALIDLMVAVSGLQTFASRLLPAPQKQFLKLHTLSHRTSYINWVPRTKWECGPLAQTLLGISKGLPWWSWVDTYNSALPLPGSPGSILVRELRSHMLFNVAWGRGKWGIELVKKYWQTVKPSSEPSPELGSWVTVQVTQKKLALLSHIPKLACKYIYI